jgi:hypothetical protein
MIHNGTFLNDPENFCSPPPAGLGKLLLPWEKASVAGKMATPQTGVGRGYRKVPTKLRVSYCRITDEVQVSVNYFPFTLAQNGTAVAAEIVDSPPDPRYTAEFTANRDQWFPIFYLPWCAGADYRMTLKQPTTFANGEPVRIFITSAVNGCSVFVEGTPQQPTVYHSNRSGGGAPPIGGNLLVNGAYWQPKKVAMEGAFLAAKSPKAIQTRGPGAPPLPSPTAVHAMDYMDVTGAQAPNRTRADDLEAVRLSPLDRTSVRFVTSHYLPFGTVFGWMQNTTWRFFFQKRACHAFEYEVTSRAGVRSPVWVTRQFAWHLEEFWPNPAGPGMAIGKGLVP